MTDYTLVLMMDSGDHESAYESVTLTPYPTAEAAMAEFDSQVRVDDGYVVRGWGHVVGAVVERVESDWQAVGWDYLTGEWADFGASEPVTVAEWARGEWTMLEAVET